jgi:hypothetical protein
MLTTSLPRYLAVSQILHQRGIGMDSTVIAGIITAVAAIAAAVITGWVTRQRNSKPSTSPDKLNVGDHDRISLDAYDLTERGLSSYNRGSIRAL